MILYLAGKPEDHQQINVYAEQLTGEGFQVISSWHRDDAVAMLMDQFRLQRQAKHNIVANLMQGQSSSTPNSDYKAVGGPSIDQQESTTERFQSEMKAADWVVADLGAASMEAGYAVGLNKQIIAIGSSQSMMASFFLDQHKFVEDWPAAMLKLASIRILSRSSRGISVG